MKSYLELWEEDRRILCQESKARLGFPATTIEKDFWVCWTLGELFNLPEWGSQFTFKGGTSLSKAWKIIQRFSEDIDIVIDRSFIGFGGEKSPDKGESQKQIRNRLDELKAACSQRIQEDLLPILQKRFESQLSQEIPWSLKMASPEEDPDQQTLLFQYPTVFSAPSSYLRPIVKMEFGARSDHEPSLKANVQSYLSETFPENLKNDSVSIMSLTHERTFLEKSMLIHEETFRPLDKIRKKGMARHYYDLWVMITKGIGDRAIQDPALFDQIADHRKIYFKWSWVDYSTLKPSTIRLHPPEYHLSLWKQDYQAMRQEMFVGEIPKFDELMEVVKEFNEKWNSI